VADENGGSEALRSKHFNKKGQASKHSAGAEICSPAQPHQNELPPDCAANGITNT